MAFQLSPGVNVSEIDLTTVVPSVSTTAGAFVGTFQWGPANKRILVDSEITLAKEFYTPDDETYKSWLTAASFLAYGNNLQVVRAANTMSYNAQANTVGANIQIANEDEFEHLFLNQTNANAHGSFVARYAGALGNSLLVSVADSNTFNNLTCTGSITTSTTSTNVTGVGTAFTTELSPGSVLYTSGNVLLGTVASIASDTSLTLTAVAAATAVSVSFKYTWAYANQFSGKPGTSAQAASVGATNDELHIIVIDQGGLFTGTQGTVLEVFPYLSKASDSKDSLGNPNYYKQVLFNRSRYVYAIDPPCYSTTYGTWGSMLAGNGSGGTPFALMNHANINNLVLNLGSGSYAETTDGDFISAWDKFTDKDQTDVSLVITADADVTVQQWVIDNIVNVRMDCIAFISPPSSAVVQQAGSETDNITTWYNDLARSTSYAVADSGWKYMFDKYNNVYRWVPLNGDIAGVCVYTDQTRDSWWSPAGFTRGNIKNVVKLAWSPSQTYRDALYSIGINPVVSLPGQGVILYGDKTLQSKPSAFDRINVRRLFILLEKAIARAAKYSLFEFNDEFTRAQFVALVTPFLRDIQGRRGIYDFKVVCDTTNNTGQVIDSNRFVGDIYVKPARSINFIQLNFVAVRTGVEFNTVVGQA